MRNPLVSNALLHLFILLHSAIVMIQTRYDILGGLIFADQGDEGLRVHAA